MIRRFYVGLHQPSDAWPFLHCMISVNRLRERKSSFRVNNWIMDSGAFTELSQHGYYRSSSEVYAEQVNRWMGNGNLQAAISQDYMCEPFIIAKTGLSVSEHQKLTIERYIQIRDACQGVYIMPVLQGFEPEEYASHVNQYGELLTSGQWVGVGSICRRNGNPNAVEDVLLAITDQRSDLKLHGFGLKKTALERPTVRELLWSCDSMAWSHHGRKNKVTGDDGNDPRRALAYCADVDLLLEIKSFIQPQLFRWWV